MDVEAIGDTWFKINLPLGERISSLYLVTGTERALLLDVGLASDPECYLPAALAQIGDDPRSVTHVVISHCDLDHFAGIASIADVLPRARTLAHRLDAPAMRSWPDFERLRARTFVEPYGVDETAETLAWMRRVAGFGSVDLEIDSTTEIDLGDRQVTVCLLPGHSAGHLGVHDSGAGVIAISDAILGDAVPLANGEPAFPPTYRYERDYLHTIERVRAIRPRVLATAHYGVFTDEGITEFLDRSRDFAVQLRDRILDQLRTSNAVTMAELIRLINRDFGRWPRRDTDAPLAFPVVGHVESLAADGCIRLDKTTDGVIIEAAT